MTTTGYQSRGREATLLPSVITDLPMEDQTFPLEKVKGGSWESFWDKCTGDIAAICNYRFAHGRPNFSLREGERRELGVILGQMYRRQGQRNDKWPATRAGSQARFA